MEKYTLVEGWVLALDSHQPHQEPHQPHQKPHQKANIRTNRCAPTAPPHRETGRTLIQRRTRDGEA